MSISQKVDGITVMSFCKSEVDDIFCLFSLVSLFIIFTIIYIHKAKTFSDLIMTCIIQVYIPKQKVLLLDNNFKIP